eukprot:84481_1
MSTSNQRVANMPEQNTNININFNMILHEAISREMNLTNPNNNKNKNAPGFCIPYTTFISLHKNEFCKLLKEQSNIAQGKSIKIYKAVKQTLHSQTNDNTSNNHQIRLDSKLRDQFHWLHVNDDPYTSELINECWNEMIKDDDIKQYQNDKEYQSKMAVLLFTMLSDKRVAKTIHKLTSTDMNMSDILYAKAVKTMKNEDYNRTLLYLDEALTFTRNRDPNDTDNRYKIWIKQSDCLLCMKQYENALHYAQKCVHIEPLCIKPYLNGGNALMELKRFDEAKEMFDKAYSLAQSNPNANQLLQKEVAISQIMMQPKKNVDQAVDAVDYTRMNTKDILGKWLHVLDGKNDVIMEFEAAQQHCKGYKTCPCLHRVLNALKVYNAWIAKYPADWKQPICAVLKEMKYSECILNDWFHVKKIHGSDDTIWDYAHQCVPCHHALCTIAQRNHTQTRTKSVYYGLEDSEDIVVLQMLDAIHSYLLHHDEDHSRKKHRFVTKVTDHDEFKSLNVGTFLETQMKMDDADHKDEKPHQVSAKYDSLKQELLSNTICPLRHCQWRDVYLRCRALRDTLHAKQEWIAHDNGLLNISSGVAAGCLIQMDALISLFLAINFDSIASLFIGCAFRRIKDESLSQLKKRYREVAIWSAQLKRGVWFFGSFCAAKDVFYHGFDKKILFGQYHVTIELPLFVTRDLSALPDRGDGIVLKLAHDTGSAIGYPYFATSFVSDFNTKDSEAILFHCSLKLNDIIYQNQSCAPYLESLCWFERITNGYYVHSSSKCEKKIMQMMQKKDTPCPCSMMAYVEELFEYFCEGKTGHNIWFIPSELNKLSKQFRELLSEFLSETTMKFVYEFKWNIAEDVLLQFHALQLEQAMVGPIFCCQMDGDSEEDDDVMDECVVFIPYCRRSTIRKEAFGEFGLVLQTLPRSIESILFEYEVCCPETSYSLCVPPQKWMKLGDNIAFTSFKTETIQNLASFEYHVALKILKCK